MSSQRAVRKLLEEYLAGRIEVEAAAEQLAPLSSGMSLIALNEGALASMPASDRARLAELFARLPQQPAKQPLHVRRLQVASHVAPADLGVRNERTILVDVFGLDAAREYKASLSLRVRSAPQKAFENVEAWHWDQATLVIPESSEHLIQHALSDWNRSTTNESWLEYCSALRSRVGDDAITETQ